MTNKTVRRSVFLAALAVLAIVLVLAFGLSTVATAFDQPSASISGTASGNQVTYSITLRNPNPEPIGNIFLAGKVPEGAVLDQATATPAGAQFLGLQDGNAVWLANSIPASGTLGPFSYRVNIAKQPIGPAWAFLRWLAPQEGTYISPQVPYQQAVAASSPRRGCLACHVLADKATGKYTLAYEAHERAEARGGEHPSVAPDGTSMKVTDVNSVATCLQCHAPGTGARTGKGNVAPLSLRDIVHPAHMFSNTFKEHYGGNCFTCHNVAGDGSFELLGEKVDVNEKGLPDPAKVPIPGALPPSQGRR